MSTLKSFLLQHTMDTSPGSSRNLATGNTFSSSAVQVLRVSSIYPLTPTNILSSQTVPPYLLNNVASPTLLMKSFSNALKVQNSSDIECKIWIWSTESQKSIIGHSDTSPKPGNSYSRELMKNQLTVGQLSLSYLPIHSFCSSPTSYNIFRFFWRSQGSCYIVLVIYSIHSKYNLFRLIRNMIHGLLTIVTGCTPATHVGSTISQQ